MIPHNCLCEVVDCEAVDVVQAHDCTQCIFPSVICVDHQLQYRLESRVSEDKVGVHSFEVSEAAYVLDVVRSFYYHIGESVQLSIFHVVFEDDE